MGDPDTFLEIEEPKKLSNYLKNMFFAFLVSRLK